MIRERKRTMGRLQRLCALLAALALTACLPDSINPLGDPATSEPDTEILGQWTGTLDGTPSKLTVTPKDGAMLEFRVETLMPGGENEWVILDGFPAAAGKDKYMNVKMREEKDKVYDPNEENYYILRYMLTPDGGMNVWAMAEQPVVNAIVDGFVNGAVDPSSEGRIIHITDSTVVVRQFVEVSNPDRLFAVKYATFRRTPQ